MRIEVEISGSLLFGLHTLMLSVCIFWMTSNTGRTRHFKSLCKRASDNSIGTDKDQKAISGAELSLQLLQRLGTYRRDWESFCCCSTILLQGVIVVHEEPCCCARILRNWGVWCVESCRAQNGINSMLEPNPSITPVSITRVNDLSVDMLHFKAAGWAGTTTANRLVYLCLRDQLHYSGPSLVNTNPFGDKVE